MDTVDEQQVGKFDLVAEKVRDGALVACDRVPAPIHERVHRLELLEDACCVDDGHEVVQARDVAQARSRRVVLESKGLCDGQGLGDARRLDDAVVEAVLCGEGCEGREQILAQRAADAAVREPAQGEADAGWPSGSG